MKKKDFVEILYKISKKKLYLRKDIIKLDENLKRNIYKYTFKKYKK